jgi:predicted DNA-binding transcriptional regulator AlpA
MDRRADPLPPVRLKPGERILTPAEAAKLRGVSRETLRLMSERGQGPRRIQLSPRRFGYLSSDFIVPESAVGEIT